MGFPYGMKNFSLELNARGLTLGIYTSHALTTCKHFPGSYGHEDQDAQDYADWGVTYVKNDWCVHSSEARVPDLAAFNALRDAINRTGIPMVYSVHWNYGWTAAPGCQLHESCPLPATAHMWRVASDISPKWPSVLRQLDVATPLAASAGPGRWNDMDMLEVGNGMSETEDQAHFTMWCMLASPLVAGNDVTRMSDATRSILTNPHALAVSQDALGRQAVMLANGTLPTSKQSQLDWQVFGRPLASPVGSFAIALLNRNRSTTIEVTVDFAALGTNASFRVLDLWQGAADIGEYDSLSVRVPPTSAKMYKLVPLLEEPLVV